MRAPALHAGGHWFKSSIAHHYNELETSVKQLFYAIRQTPYGWVGALASSQGLRRSVMPQPSPQEVMQKLGPESEQAERAETAFQALFAKLERFLKGEQVTFDEAIDPNMGTPFLQQVWRCAREIPYGETRSYAWLARRAGYPGAARAVGQAMARNPAPPVVPCHRVIGADGSLGGYSGGGVEVKRRLLTGEAPGRGKRDPAG